MFTYWKSYIIKWANRNVILKTYVFCRTKFWNFDSKFFLNKYKDIPDIHVHANQQLYFSLSDGESFSDHLQPYYIVQAQVSRTSESRRVEWAEHGRLRHIRLNMHSGLHMELTLSHLLRTHAREQEQQERRRLYYRQESLRQLLQLSHLLIFSIALVLVHCGAVLHTFHIEFVDYQEDYAVG